MDRESRSDLQVRAGLRLLVSALAITLVAIAAISPARALGIALEPPFDSSYSFNDIGSPPGVPPQLGGLTLKAGTSDRLLIGGEANTGSGALYEIGVTRDGLGHINGFSDTATRVADAAFNDGGVTYGPGGVLFLARWPANELGQTKPGSSITDKIIDVGSLGVAGSLSSVYFVPPGLPGAGSIKLASWSGGEWYDADITPDGTGTYDLQNVTGVPGSTLPGGPEGFVYVDANSPEFSGPSLIVSEYSAGSVAAYDVDANGDPAVATRRTFISGLTGAEGAFIDPVAGDFLFSTFGGGSQVVVVSGFAPPEPYPRPGGATPIRVPLVVAYAQCVSPNSTHVGPLDSPSCSGAAQESGQLTTSKVGRQLASVRIRVVPGNRSTPEDEADFGITASIRDVVKRSDGADYTGEVILSTKIRVTDKGNGAAGLDPGTVDDTEFSLPIQCAATADPAYGGSCAISTTADGLVPNFVQEGKRAIVSTQSLNLLDAGPDGDITPPSGTCPITCGTGDERVYLSQGVFTP